MLATYSEWGFCYSDAMMQTRQSQQCFKAGGSSQTITQLTRSVGYRYLKKMIVSLVWSKKNNKEKRLFVVFFDLDYYVAWVVFIAWYKSTLANTSANASCALFNSML